MSQILASLNVLAGPVPGFEPTVPKELKGPTGTILGWAAGMGLSLAVLGTVIGFACIGFGQHTERAELAARGKRGIVMSLVSGLGIGLASSLVLAFYALGTGG